MKDNSILKRITIAAAILVFLLVLVLASYLLQDRDDVIGSISGAIVSVIQKPFAFLSDKTDGGILGFLSDYELKNANDKLKKENEALRKQLILDEMNSTELEELKSLSQAFSMPGVKGGYSLLATNVISYDSSDLLRTFTIDRGEESGLSENTVIIDGKGLIGRVVTVGKGYAKVNTIIDENTKVGFMVENRANDIGLLSGDGKGKLEGYFLENKYKPQKGDVLYTSGVGGLFPTGIPIGEITDIKKSKERISPTIVVEPFAKNKKLRKVAAIIDSKEKTD